MQKNPHFAKFRKWGLTGLVALSSAFGLTTMANAASPDGDVVGRTVVGYQGWHWGPGDGSAYSNLYNWWYHFNPSPGSESDTNYHNIEMWPDIREYTTTFPTNFANFGNGQAARMYSSYSDSTVNTHFRWMKDYGIYAAALQRFGGDLADGSNKATRDNMALKVKTAAEAQGRKFYIMYDISGWTNIQQKLKDDWTNTIINSLHLTSSSAYAKQNGKPVVCIWGMGYDRVTDTGQGNAAICLDLVNWFKAQGCYVIGGVPGQWRNGTGDSRADFQNVYKAVDMINPWSVGGVVDYNFVQADLALANSWGKDYQPGANPGTSFFWGNRSPKNLLARNHGDFLWSYFNVYRQLGIRNCYVAMFDEVDEGTAIYKVAEDATMQPTNQWFLPLDADGVHVSSDFYLRVTQDGIKMLRGELPFIEQHPTLHVASASGTITNGTYELQPMNAPGMRLDVSGRVDADNVNVQLWSRNSGLGQAMRVISVGSGYYELAPFCAPSRRINVAGGGTANSTNVNILLANGSTAQRWKITDIGGGAYELEPQCAVGKRLNVNGAGTANSANIDIYQTASVPQQRWRIIPVVVPDTVYQLEPQCALGKRLDLKDGLTTNGTYTHIWGANNASSQDWKVTAVGSNYYELAPASSGARLDVAGQSSANGTTVQAWQSIGNTGQRWRLLDIGGGIYELEPQCALGKRLNVNGQVNADGTKVTISQANAISGQRWKLWVRGSATQPSAKSVRSINSE